MSAPGYSFSRGSLDEASVRALPGHSVPFEGVVHTRGFDGGPGAANDTTGECRTWSEPCRVFVGRIDEGEQPSNMTDATWRERFEGRWLVILEFEDDALRDRLGSAWFGPFATEEMATRRAESHRARNWSELLHRDFACWDGLPLRSGVCPVCWEITDGSCGACGRSICGDCVVCEEEPVCLDGVGCKDPELQPRRAREVIA